MTMQITQRRMLPTLTILLFIFNHTAFLQSNVLGQSEKADQNRIKRIAGLLPEKPAGFGLPIGNR
ncbi:MAG: hypothetical protein ABIF19_04595, partial [Planctomycetota bacterium]